MKVLHITTSFPTGDNPTQGLFVKRQIDSLEGVNILSDAYPMTVKESRSPRIWRDVRRKVTRESYDLVHCHYGYALLPTILLKNVPIIVSFGGSDLLGRGNWRSCALRMISNILSLKAKQIIVKSEQCRERLWFTSSRRKSTLIPNGVNMSDFFPQDRGKTCDALGMDTDRKYVLFAGRQDHPVKRVEMIREAVKTLKKSGFPVELNIVSNCNTEKLNMHYAACDVLALASKHEGSPNVVKEAMACNLPIVSFDVGDVRSVIRDTANCYIVEETVQGLVEGFTKVLDAGVRSNGSLRIDHLKEAHIARRVRDVYERALSVEG